MRYHYGDGDLKKIVNSMVVVIDSRENENSHVVDYFKRKKINYIIKKLDYGDYSFYIPKDESLNIERDTYFSDEVVLERKANLTELSGNLTKNRDRFENELLRKKGCRFYIMVEDGSWDKINAKMYRTNYMPESYLATLFTYMTRYNVSVDFASKEFAGKFIYSIFKYYLREKFKNHKLEV